MDTTTKAPSIIDEIGAVIGTAATMRLVAVFGGSNLYIPETVPPAHPLAVALGHEAARKLSQTFAREQVEIPDGEEFTRLQRVRRVAALLRANISARDIGELIGCSTRSVHNYRVEAEKIGILPMVFGDDAGAAD